MAITYRSVDAEALAATILSRRAQEATETADRLTAEVARLEEAIKVATGDAKTALSETLKTTKAAQSDAVKRASRLNADVVIDVSAQQEERRGFLVRHIASLESEHVAHVTLLAQREEALALTGTEALSPEVRATMEQQAASNRDAIKVIESAHSSATKELDAMPAPVVPTPTPTPVEPAPADPGVDPAP